MFPWWGHFLQYFISIPEKVFFINPGSQVWTARRPHHFLQTIFCLLNPNYAPAIWRFCVDLLLETAGLGWWSLDTEQHTNSMSARKHLPAAPLCIWRVVCALVVREPCSVLTNAHCNSLLKAQQRYFSYFSGGYVRSWSLMEIDGNLGKKCRWQIVGFTLFTRCPLDRYQGCVTPHDSYNPKEVIFFVDK